MQHNTVRDTLFCPCLPSREERWQTTSWPQDCSKPVTDDTQLFFSIMPSLGVSCDECVEEGHTLRRAPVRSCIRFLAGGDAITQVHFENLSSASGIMAKARAVSG